MAAETQPGTTAVASSADTKFFGHPRGLATLFMTELWERFNYYGMRALLILYMTAPVATGGLGFDVVQAGAVYGLVTASVYMLSVPGGWIADRFIGQRRAVLYGGIVIAAGALSLSAPGFAFFYGGLILIVLGTGLLKPNVSTIVGQLYGPNDPRRDAGFSIYYMGVNLGGFLAPLACGWIAAQWTWRAGFAVAGIGMIAGLIQYSFGDKHLGDAGKAPAPAKDASEQAANRRLLSISLLTIVGLAVLAFILNSTGIANIDAQFLSNALGFVLLATVAGFFIWVLFLGSWEPVDRKRLMAVLCLFVASSVFWSIFEQAGSTLNLFAQRNTETSVFGFDFPPSWLQSLNSLFIISFAPLFAWLWTALGSREPSSPAKFVLGLLNAGGGFLLLVGAASIAETGVRVSVLWLTGVYLLHTFGELCLSPVGMSAMTKLAPQGMQGLLMGVFFLSISVGNYMGGRVASLYESFSLPNLFLVTGLFGVGAAILLAVLVNPIKKLMGGVK